MASVDFQRLIRTLRRRDPGPALTMLEQNPDWLLAPQTLLEACQHSHPQVVEKALGAGADANVRSVSTPGAWRVPIGRAVEAHDGEGRWNHAQRQVADLLRAHGVDLDQRSCFGMRRPLGLAAEAGHLDAARWLIEHGAEVGFEESCALGDTRAVKAALENDPSLATRPRASGTKHFYNVLLPLDAVAGSRLGQRDPSPGNRPIADTLLEVAGLLIEAGSPVGRWDHVGESGEKQTFSGPAAAAACAGNTELLRLCLDAGADPQACLGSALHGGSRPALDLLAKRGVDVDQPGDAKLGNHLLHEMVRWGQLENALWVLDRLLEQGASTNPLDHEGFTPFHYAARRGVNPKWAEALRERGVDPRRPAHDGRRPVDIARSKKRTKLLAWFESLV